MITRLIYALKIRPFVFILLGVPTMISIVLGALAIGQASELSDAVDAAVQGRGGGATAALESWSPGYSRMLVMGQILIVIVIGTITVQAVGRRVIARVLVLLENARRVADGDLTVRTRVRANDELGELERSFGEMVGSIAQVVTDIDSAASNLQNDSVNMAHTADEAGRARGLEHR